eukprot:CAMPEP_0173275272 /NCGR_PEP_ID=MMETSP1143-20121109/2890_1 /TAXON_ID=483371 /ORGANISM="non described non described, Strain CCMP2298" /LENGTH=82 /DNA_ID=CAMNT_0014212149 /DNA_START=785 /DNA_END=1034 /DNA_ORIENTATION=-
MFNGKAGGAGVLKWLLARCGVLLLAREKSPPHALSRKTGRAARWAQGSGGYRAVRKERGAEEMGASALDSLIGGRQGMWIRK